MRIPPPIIADAYTISSYSFASSLANENSLYNMTNRVSPAKNLPELCSDSRMVMFGLDDFVHKHLTDRITQEDIDNSERFMARAGSFGTGLFFPKEMWQEIVHTYNGYLPLKIEAIKEGSTFFPNEPYIQIRSTAKGFGELAAHYEAVMLGMVSIATCRATMSRHWLHKIKKIVSLHSLPEKVMITAQFMIHDFGMRASSVEEESRLLGKAHLLSFNGTDTMNAAYEAWMEGCHPLTGTSIHALAHRNVQGYEKFGIIGQYMQYLKLAEVSKDYGNIASYITDCYDFKRATQEIVDIVVDKKLQGKAICAVARPDSGNAVDNVVHIVGLALAAKLMSADAKPSATHMRFIEGNSVIPGLVDEVFAALDKMGVNPVGWGIFGVGGYLRNTCTRDTLSSKYALAAVGDFLHEVCKLSEELIKMSVPGETILRRPTLDNLKSVLLSHEGQEERKIPYYICDREGLFIKEKDKFSDKQDRCINDFDSYTQFVEKHPDFGTNRKHYSDKICKIQDRTRLNYRK